MVVYVTSAEVGADRRLTVELPENVPIGRVKITVESEPALTREELRARLQEAGLLSNGPILDESAVRLDEEERHRIAELLRDTTPLEQIVDEERGPR